MYLVVDTSTKYAGVGLFHQGRLLRATCWYSQQNHTVKLAPAVDTLLSSAGVAPGDLQGLGIALGPGGFSVLRAGMSMVKGLAFALDLPVVGVSTLEAEAHPHCAVARLWWICPLLPMGRGRIAWATYRIVRGRWQRQGEEHTGSAEELAESVSTRTLFCGEAAPEYASLLQQALKRRAIVVTPFTSLARLAGLAARAAARLDRGEADSMVSLQPNYLRPPGITQPRMPQPVRRGAVRGKAARDP